MSAVRLAARAVVVSALGFTLVPVLGASPAYACSCIQSTEQENYERADVVFKGILDDVKATKSQFGEQVFTFTPSKTYKGATTKPQQVSSAGNSAACGVNLSGSGPFLVFAHKAEGDAKAPLTTSLCSGTREIKADEEPDFKASNPVQVDKGESAPTPSEPADEREGRSSAGGGSDPSGPVSDPDVDPAPDGEPSAPDARPEPGPPGDEPVMLPVSDGDAVDTPLMMQTGAVAANDTAGESASAAGDSDGVGWLPLAAAIGLVGAAAAGTGWAVRRRRA